MRSILCFAAKGVIRDAETGTISVYSILEQLNAEGFPFFMQEMGVLGVWKREAGDAADIDLQVRIRNNDRVLLNGPVRVAFADKQLHRTIVNFRGLVVQEVGQVHFEFVRNDNVIASYSIDIQAAAAQALPAGG